MLDFVPIIINFSLFCLKFDNNNKKWSTLVKYAVNKLLNIVKTKMEAKEEGIIQKWEILDNIIATSKKINLLSEKWDKLGFLTEFRSTKLL